MTKTKKKILFIFVIVFSTGIYTLSSAAGWNFFAPVVDNNRSNAISNQGDIIFVKASSAGGSLKVYDGTTWQSLDSTIANANIQSVSSPTIQLDTSADVVLVSASSNDVIVTLPLANVVSGKVITIKRTDSIIANSVTINRSGATDEIDGVTSKKLSTQFESIQIVSNGTTDWHLLNRSIPSEWTPFTANFGGTLGWVASISAFQRRVGDSLELSVHIAQVTGAGSPLDLVLTLPDNLTIDTAKTANSNTNGTLGYFQFHNPGGSAAGDNGFVNVATSDIKAIRFVRPITAAGFTTTLMDAGGSDSFSIRAFIPIENWEN